MTTQGPVRPYTHGATIEVAASPSIAATESATPPITEEETHARWFGTAPGLASEGASAGAGPEAGGGLLDNAFCNYTVKGKLSDLTDNLNYVAVTVTDQDGSGTIDSNDIDMVISDAITSTDNTVITVPAGTYDELTIDLTMLEAHVVLVSEYGPDPAIATNSTIFEGVGSAPAVTITGSIYNGAGQFTFGWHDADTIGDESPVSATGDPLVTSGWHGFELIAGYPQNLVIETIWAGAGGAPPDMIEVRGNYIHDNNCQLPSACGVAVAGAAGPVDIIANDVSQCCAVSTGAGIRIDFDQNAEKVTLAENFIHDNACTAPTALTDGGGVYVKSGGAVDLCGNFIDNNRAQRGAGVALIYTNFSTSNDMVFYLESNWIRGNAPHNGVGGRGGGIFAIAPAYSAPRWNLGIVRNRVFNNGQSNDGTLTVEQGGGMDISVDFADAEGPYRLVDGSDIEGQLFIGNAIAGNQAKTMGGGVYFNASATRPMQFWTNTIAFNDLTDPIATNRHGYGLYVTPGVTDVVVSSNIVHKHDEPSGGERDWYAASARFGDLDYSDAPDCYGGGSGDSPEDLQPSSLGAPDLEVNPQSLRFSAELASSLTIDAGERYLISDVHDRLKYDFDGEPRHNDVPGIGAPGDAMDMGADEWYESQLFVRGDINADGTFDISDAVFALAALFTPGSSPPTCPDAGDANDDGLFDISDAIFTLARLFVPGSPPPPPPYPTCGSDPLPVDGLECRAFDACP